MFYLELVLFINTYFHGADERTRQILRLNLLALRQANDKIDRLQTQLNESETFWTIMKFNQYYELNWNMRTCQRNGKRATLFSRRSGYEIRRCRTNDERFIEVNSYAYEVLERLFLKAG